MGTGTRILRDSYVFYRIPVQHYCNCLYFIKYSFAHQVCLRTFESLKITSALKKWRVMINTRTARNRILCTEGSSTSRFWASSQPVCESREQLMLGRSNFNYAALCLTTLHLVVEYRPLLFEKRRYINIRQYEKTKSQKPEYVYSLPMPIETEK